MAGTLPALVLCCTVLLAVPTRAEEPRPAAVTLEQVKEYLAAMGGDPQVTGEGELRAQARAEGRSYAVLVKLDPKHFLCYLALTEVFVLRADDPRRAAVTDRIARLNWDLALGKLEWNAETGEVRLSHSFSTEDGLGRRELTGALATLLAAAGPVRRALEEAAGRSAP